MIQRVQTLYLFLGVIALVAMPLFGGMWDGTTAGRFAWFSPVVLILGGLSILLALWAIFLYDDRKRQRKIVVGVQATTLVLLAVFVGAMYFAGDFARWTTGEIIGVICPVVAYTFFFLARRGIESDIKLVKSMDRLRE